MLNLPDRTLSPRFRMISFAGFTALLIGSLTWIQLHGYDDALSAVQALGLPARVPVQATLADGRSVDGFAAPYALACLNTRQQTYPEQPLSRYALFQMPARPDVLGSGPALPVRELRLDPGVKAKLNTLSQSVKENLNCHLEQTDQPQPVTLNTPSSEKPGW